MVLVLVLVLQHSNENRSNEMFVTEECLLVHVVVGYLLNKINVSNVNEFYVAFFNQKPLPDTVCFSHLVSSNHTSLPSALPRIYVTAAL